MAHTSAGDLCPAHRGVVGGGGGQRHLHLDPGNAAHVARHVVQLGRGINQHLQR